MGAFFMGRKDVIKMDTVIQVKCIDQTLIITNSPVIASGGLNENKLECDFCEKWDGFAKTAIFYQDKNNVYYSLLDEDDTCTIPKEATINKGTMFFGIFGTKGDVTRTSEVLRYKIVDGAITEDIKPSDPTPDIYEQIVTRLSRIENETIPNSIATHNTSSVAHKDIRDDISDIEGKIPSQATSTNQLADKDFVNSSIATNTAYFKGTFNIVDDLGLSRTATHEQVATAIANKVTDATNNDYSFVAIPNETITTEIDQYDRYKFNGTSWAYEFTLNNSSFTSVQWDAINSGITSSDVSQIATNKSSITNLQNNKQDKLVSGTNIKTINGVSILGEGDIKTQNAELLWTNETPTSEFASQTITLDLSNYKAVCITFFYDNGYPHVSSFALVGESSNMVIWNWYLRIREFIVKTNGITFLNGRSFNSFGIAGNKTNDLMTPVNIYGIK